tara:strand:- start:216 stop:587 length:372 start_codon:yes stop_codon:yes gene_type:complete
VLLSITDSKVYKGVFLMFSMASIEHILYQLTELGADHTDLDPETAHAVLREGVANMSESDILDAKAMRDIAVLIESKNYKSVEEELAELQENLIIDKLPTNTANYKSNLGVFIAVANRLGNGD